MMYVIFSSSAKEIVDLKSELKGKEKVKVEELENKLLKQKDNKPEPYTS